MNGGNSARTRLNPALVTAALFVLLVLVRLPYFLTHHVQEDAYIAWRCARNLLQTGVYGFNPGVRVSASTSHTSVLITAAVMAVFKSHFILALLTVHVAMLVGAIYLLATGLLADRRQALALWVIVSLLPVSLRTSYSGMETPLVLLLAALALRGIVAPAWRWRVTAAVALFLLPLTRPDAVGFGLVALAYAAWARRRTPWLDSAALGLGLVAFLLFDKLYFGTWLPQTVIAKSQLYHPLHSASAIWNNLITVFPGAGGFEGVYSLMEAHFFHVLAWPTFILVVVLLGVSVWTTGWETSRGKLYVALAAMAIGLPAAYAAISGMFPWYFWPAAIFADLVILATLIRQAARLNLTARRCAFAGVAILVLGLMAAQWCLSFSAGVEEYDYRRGIGLDLARLMGPSDSLFLEPAGYIPFYAGRYTIDEVGLVSPDVTDFRGRYGADWCFQYLQQRRPRFIVQRRPFHETSTFDVDGKLSPTQRAWFDEHYERIKRYDYDPSAYVHSPVLLRIARMGHAIGYDIYKLKSGD